MRLPPATPGPARRVLAPLLVLLGACASAETVKDRDPAWLIDQGRYVEAVQVAEGQAAKHPGDPRAQERLRMARAAAAMGEGRRLSFADRDEEALERFLEAQALAPEAPEVEKWIGNTRAKLADRCQQEARSLHMADELFAAAEMYERALAFDADDPESAAGLARVLLQINHRSGVGEKYYREGIKALDDHRIGEARARFAYTIKYTPENERAQGRHQEAGRLLASTRAAEAAKLEQRGLFSAARNEYRIALLHDRTQPDALAGLERTTREERVAKAMQTADALLMRKRYGEALAALEHLDEVTAVQGDALADFRGRIVEAQLADVYATARALELDGLYEEALETYDRLLTLTPFFRDAIARRDTLQSYIAEAADLYARAGEAQTDEERARLLRRITVFWPQYRDVLERLQALDASLGSGPAAGAGSR